MGKIVYNKLVRDRIPEIIEADGKVAKIEILSDKEYIEMLEKKLFEELNEYMGSRETEELADLLEVIYALSISKGINIEKLENIRREKAEKRGAFEKKVLLKEVIE